MPIFGTKEEQRVKQLIRKELRGGADVTNTSSVSGDATLTERDGLVVADTTGGVVTLTLPAIGGAPIGQTITVKRNGGNNDVVVNAASGDKIDGGSSVTVGEAYNAVAIQSDGSQWWIV